MEFEKHLLITGSSNTSWKDAITKTIAEASKTIDFISSVKVINQYAKIENDKIAKYLVDLDLGFTLDLDR